MAQFIDWELAAATAARLGKSGPAVSQAEAAAAVADLRRYAEEAKGHVSEFTGLTAGVACPPARVVDRKDWAAANIVGLREVITPLAERLSSGKAPGPIIDAVGSRITGLQAGTLLAYLSGRVLGQYDVLSSDPGELLLVAPNIVETERRLAVLPRDFRLWVCLHEVTHQVQFTGVPWMRGHFLAELQAFVDESQLDGQHLVERLRQAAAAVSQAVREPDSSISLLDLVQTPAQRAILERLSALMTLLEGHAEYVMDGVGPTVVPTVGEIRAKFDRRRQTANPLERLLRKLLGIEVKLRQYTRGNAFVRGVVDQAGMRGFHAVWQSPENLPTMPELSDPPAWVTRVLGGENGGRVSNPTAD
jgi:coenzyme F420 biosynthesis associated uncharacterized protein